MIATGFIVCGCDRSMYDDKNPLDEVRGFYESPHKLRKMFSQGEEITVKKPGEGHISGGFFFFMGGMSGEYKDGTEVKHIADCVRFAWEIKDNTYLITTLPLEKIRIRVVENLESPSVSFFLDKSKVTEVFYQENWRYSTYELNQKNVEKELGAILKNYYNPEEAISTYLEYVVFTVQSENWPANINLPVNTRYRE